MIKWKHIVLILFLFSKGLFCLNPPTGYKPKGFRINLGPTISFYSLKTKHAVGAAPKPGGMIGIKKEFNVGKDHKTFFLVGAEYFFHGVKFKSYYFDQDTLQLYDKSFAYEYNVMMHEISVPLQVKFSFTKENNSLFSPYIMLGYHLRYMLPAKVNVTQEGNPVIGSKEDVRFKIPLMGDRVNAAASISLGWQKNIINNSKSGFFVEANFKYGFSQYKLDASYGPSSLYMNSGHFTLLLGLTF